MSVERKIESVDIKWVRSARWATIKQVQPAVRCFSPTQPPHPHLLPFLQFAPSFLASLVFLPNFFRFQLFSFPAVRWFSPPPLLLFLLLLFLLLLTFHQFLLCLALLYLSFLPLLSPSLSWSLPLSSIVPFLPPLFPSISHLISSLLSPFPSPLAQAESN